MPWNVLFSFSMLPEFAQRCLISDWYGSIWKNDSYHTWRKRFEAEELETIFRFCGNWAPTKCHQTKVPADTLKKAFEPTLFSYFFGIVLTIEKIKKSIIVLTIIISDSVMVLWGFHRHLPLTQFQEFPKLESKLSINSQFQMERE